MMLQRYQFCPTAYAFAYEICLLMLLAITSRQPSSSIMQLIQDHVMIMHMLSLHYIPSVCTTQPALVSCIWFAPAQLTMHRII